MVLGIEAAISSDVLIIFLLLKGLNSLIIGCTVVGAVKHRAVKKMEKLSATKYI